MLTTRLKTETLQAHQQLEKEIVTRLKSMRSHADYTRMLSFFYGYFGGLEQQLLPFTFGLSDYKERRKAAALANDLTFMGIALPELAAGESLPDIKNPLQAYGALYVMEGSTLGGKIISQMVSKQLGLTGPPGLSFFESYGDETPAMWAKFRVFLDDVTKNNNEEEAVIAAANETFEKFREWIEYQDES